MTAKQLELSFDIDRIEFMKEKYNDICEGMNGDDILNIYWMIVAKERNEKNGI